MPRARLDWGDWNAICDVCGFRFKASEMKKRWDNLMVCKQDYEHRNPQDLLRVRGDQPSVPWSRPEPTDVFVPVCWIWGTSAYADLGQVDCMKVDYAPLTYQQVFDMKWSVPPSLNPEVAGSGIPGYAIPGYGIPGVTFTGL